MAEQEKQREVDPVTGAATGPEGSGSSGSSITGTGAKTDRGKMHNGEETMDTDHHADYDRHAQGNLGGRSPGQAQTSIGDQDSTQNRNDVQLADPMTSRAPNQVNQKDKQELDKDKQGKDKKES